MAANRMWSGKNLASIGALAAIYFVAGKLGLALAFVHPSSTAVWPPAGIALACLLLLGYDVWPGIFLGAFLVNIATAGTAATSLGIATGNTLEALIGAYLVNRFAGGRNAFHDPRDVFKFAFLAGMLSTAVAATFGVTSLALGGFARWSDYGAIWLTWWLGDGVGDVVVAPLLVLWGSDRHLEWNLAWAVEVFGLLGGMSVAALAVFCGLFFHGARAYPLEYLCIPFLIWAGLRFGQRKTATAMLLLAGIATWGTYHGLGPFARQSRNESLLLLQAFMGVVAVTTIAIAAVSEERRRAEEQARKLAVSDPLTGLANYRKLIDTLEAEIKRSGRTGRPFAVLLLDLDGLKKINDTYGHLVGSWALCRLAAVLRFSCREIDTAARYGGDEFALVLPEVGAGVATQVARRISERLNDGEQPPLSASIGHAVFPADGKTINALLTAADEELYSQKPKPHRETTARIRRPRRLTAS